MASAKQSQPRKQNEFSIFVLPAMFFAQSKTLVRCAAERALSKLSMMVAMLSLAGKEQKVFPSVVHPVAVNVMDNLFWKKQSSKFFLDYPPVLKYVMAFPVFRALLPNNLNVSVCRYSSSPLEVRIALWSRLNNCLSAITAKSNSVSGPFFRFVIGNRSSAFSAIGVFNMFSHAEGLSTINSR